VSGVARRLGFARRGPRPASPPDAPRPTSWDEEVVRVAPEHRDSLAEAERDAAYRWAAHAVRDRDVLDIGSGAGHGAALLKEAGARSVLGVDADPRAVEVATRLYGEGIRFLAAEPMSLPLAADSFAAVVCFGALESAPDPGALLEQLLRVLSDDGVLLASLPALREGDLGNGPGSAGWASSTGAAPSPNGAAPRDRRDELAARFRHLRSYRIGIRTAATVAPAEDAGPVPIDEAVWLSGDGGEDRTVVVAAANAALPELPSVATLSGLRDLRAYREQIAAWEERARRAEAEGAAKHWELVAAREAQRRLRKRLFTLEHRPLRVLSRVVRGKPAKLGPGPPIRVSEREPEPWE